MLLAREGLDEKIVGRQVIYSVEAAVLEYADGTALEEGAEPGVGQYRFMCYLLTGDGLAQGYVYLDLTSATE